MNPQTIKVSLESIEIPAFNQYVHIISILIILFLIQKIWGHQISAFISLCLESIKTKFVFIKHENWIAHCRQRKNWPQKQDTLGLDLKGRYLRTLTFSVTLMGNPLYWRAGFVLGNEKLRANEIVDSNNGITIHIGSEYAKSERILPVWKYYDNFKRANPDFSTVKSENAGLRIFKINIDKNNFMQVWIQNELIFAQRINSSFRRRIYLKAWVDTNPDAKIKFRDIVYTLWS